MVHLYAAEFVWLEALLGNEDPLIQGDLSGNQQGEGGITSLDDLREKWIALEQRWSGYWASLTPESLDELVYSCTREARVTDSANDSELGEPMSCFTPALTLTTRRRRSSTCSGKRVRISC